MNKELFQFKTDEEYIRQDIGALGKKLTELLLNVDQLMNKEAVVELIKIIYIKEAAIQDLSNRLVPEALTAMMEEFKNLVEEEEEFDGPMPEELKSHLSNFETEDVCRQVVQTTKKNIIKRLDEVGMKLQVVFKDAPEKSEEV